MKDMIDERNFREKCAKSIVKWYNVRYTMPEETAEKPAEAEEEVQAEGYWMMRADGRIFRQRGMER